MPRIWKYCIARALRSQDNQAERKLEKLGHDGWELVAMDYNGLGYWTFFLKQEVYELPKQRLV